MSKKGAIQSTPGAPTASQLKALRKEADAHLQESKYIAVNMPDNQLDNEFPLIPFARDTYDATAEMKGQVANLTNTNWVVPFDQGDAAYVNRKRDALEQADYDRWIYQKYDLAHPANVKLLQELAPSQYERRLAVIDTQQNLVSRYAKIRLRGPKDESDLKFEWMVETGRIQLPKGPIWDPKQWLKETKYGGYAENSPDAVREWTINYQKGLLTTLSAPTRTTSGWLPNPNAASDIRGVPNSTIPGQLSVPANRQDQLFDILYAPANERYPSNDPYVFRRSDNSQGYYMNSAYQVGNNEIADINNLYNVNRAANLNNAHQTGPGSRYGHV